MGNPEFWEAIDGNQWLQGLFMLYLRYHTTDILQIWCIAYPHGDQWVQWIAVAIETEI